MYVSGWKLFETLQRPESMKMTETNKIRMDRTRPSILGGTGRDGRQSRYRAAAAARISEDPTDLVLLVLIFKLQELHWNCRTQNSVTVFESFVCLTSAAAALPLYCIQHPVLELIENELVGQEGGGE